MADVCSLCRGRTAYPHSNFCDSCGLLTSTSFNPIELNDDLNINNMLSDADPDSNYYLHSYPDLCCNYYLEDTFNTKIGHINNNTSVRETFSILHHNIRSAPANLKSLELYLSNLNLSFSVVCLSETWLTDSNASLFTLPEYNHESLIRKHRRGGGVSILIKEGFNYRRREDLSLSNDSVECLTIELTSSGCNTVLNNTLITVIYRPPNTAIESFIDVMEPILNRIKNETKPSYLAGDYNVDLLKCDTHSSTQRFIENLFSFSYIPLISKPTRVAQSPEDNASTTLIDNIFSNSVHSDKLLQGIFYTGISDHFPIFSILNLNGDTSNSQYPAVCRHIRNTSPQNIESFSQRLQTTDWSDVYNSQDSQESFTIFHNKLTYLYNDCFPFKTKRNNYINRKPWLSSGLKKCIRIKNKLFVKKSKNPTLTNTHIYKRYRKTLNQTLEFAEKEHYDYLLNMHKSNLKKSWQVIKEILNKKKTNSISDRFLINDQLVTYKHQIASNFNDYFTNIGSTLAEKIDPSPVDPLSYITNNPQNSIVIEPSDPTEISYVVNNLKNSSPGWDDIGIKILKKVLPSIGNPLMYVINLSLSQGVVPSELKKAKVIPLFKGGDPVLLNNYRPISILPSISKILEKIMYKRIESFINRHAILNEHQFGFRPKYGSNLALINTIDNILQAQERDEFTLGVFLDFRKAFDTVNHRILCNKLYSYGIRGTALEWIRNYLDGRYQYIQYEHIASEVLLTPCGVPQGSILGPLLFLLYINDITNVSDILSLVLFADDTSAFISGKDINTLINVLNGELSKITEWIKANMLSINISKTNYILFRTKNKRCTITDNITFGDQIIERVTSTRFLGVIINESLSWAEHITHISKKISKGIGIISKARKLLNFSTCLKLYYSFIYPYLTYCVEVWGGTYPTVLDPLIKLQKKSVRVLHRASFNAHTDPIFREHSILKFSSIYKYSIMVFMFKWKVNLLPTIFQNYFVLNSEFRNASTRQSNLLRIPKMRLTVSFHMIRYKGVLFWNSSFSWLQRTFPEFSTTINSFKKKYHKCLLEKQ